MSHQLMTLSELETVVPFILATPLIQPLILVGPPGVAKTQWLKTVYREAYATNLGIAANDVGFLQIRTANRDAAEIAGVALPMKDDNGDLVTVFTKPPLVTQIEEEVAKGFEHGIVNLDELLQAGGDVQKVFSDMLDPEEHSLAGWDIPRGWIICGTGNRSKDKAGATRFLSQNTNRCVVVEIDPIIEDWAKWARANGINPIVIDCAVAYADQEFFANAVPTEDVAFCTWRSLVTASKHIDAFFAMNDFEGVLPPIVEKLVAANIGPISARTLANYVAQAGEVPTVEEILANPETCKVPDQTGFQMLAGNTAIYAATTAESGEKVLQYLTRLRPDLQVSLGTKLLRVSARKNFVMTSGLAQEFISKFHDLLPLAHSHSN